LDRTDPRIDEGLRVTLRDLDAHFVDALPALRHALETHEMPYPESADGHPTASGYASIAAVVAAALPAPGRAVHNDGGEL
jgi:hypothetical protein